jgi:hypothetical protein
MFLLLPLLLRPLLLLLRPLLLLLLLPLPLLLLLLLLLLTTTTTNRDEIQRGVISFLPSSTTSFLPFTFYTFKHLFRSINFPLKQ